MFYEKTILDLCLVLIKNLLKSIKDPSYAEQTGTPISTKVNELVADCRYNLKDKSPVAEYRMSLGHSLDFLNTTVLATVEGYG